MQFIRVLALSCGTLLIAHGGAHAESTAAAGERAPGIEAAAWLAGYWSGNGLGGESEEIWSAPKDGTMMAAFRQFDDGKTLFYELSIITEQDQTLVLMIKHFDASLVGWEDAADVAVFPLLAHAPGKLVFDGISYQYLGNDRMQAIVAIGTDDGEQIATFEFERRTMSVPPTIDENGADDGKQAEYERSVD